MTTPYWRTIRTIAKGRWYGRSKASIAAELAPGVIIECPDVVTPQTVITYRVHVHEPPAPLDLPILAETPEYVVVNKPSGLPTHPTVNYIKHSVTEVLNEKYPELKPCFRLDRLTSGVLVLARTAEALKRFLAAEKSKVYIARIRGIPGWTSKSISEPIVNYNGKLGWDAFQVSWKKRKPAVTSVEIIGKSEGLCVLQCKPITGRMHQIRKHLALAGYPIWNDPIYNDGLFANLCSHPDEISFNAVHQAYECRRDSKLTGEVCSECGAPLYASVMESLDLHCLEYQFEEYKYTAPPPFDIE